MQVVGAVFLVVACGLPAIAAPQIHFVEQEQVRLRVKPLNARLAGDAALPVLEIDELTSAEAELRLLWPDPESVSLLTLRAEWLAASPGPGRSVRIESELVTSGGSRIEATRDLTFNDEMSTTSLFEVARYNDQPLTLAIEGAIHTETKLSALPLVGAPVEFLLEILWIEGGDEVSLETNQMHTFVGQPVTYSFELGPVDKAETARVRLMPAQLVGDTLRIQVEMSGTLPDGQGGVGLISRSEEWLSTYGRTSSLDLAAGDPPKGFRFRVTSRF